MCSRLQQNTEPNSAADGLSAAATTEVWLAAAADAVPQRDCGNELNSVSRHSKISAFVKHAVRFIVHEI